MLVFKFLYELIPKGISLWRLISIVTDSLWEDFPVKDCAYEVGVPEGDCLSVGIWPDGTIP